MTLPFNTLRQNGGPAADRAMLVFTAPHNPHVLMPESDLDDRVDIAYVS
jgi:hypothetical protein